MNQFEYMHRAHKALAMFAFHLDMKVISVTIEAGSIEAGSIEICGFVGDYSCTRTYAFSSLASLESQAYGF